MEGSNREVKEYEYLAYYYDYLLGDEEAFDYWLKYINDKPFKTCLELASGSGVLANILKKQGVDIIASDISENMKEVALKNYNLDYRILNMIDFKLDSTFDLILCVVDSINYLYLDEMDKMFENVYKHLNTGGRFIFDMHNIKRLEEFCEEYIEEGQIDKDTFYQWTINSDLQDKTISEHFTFYTKQGMISEQHTQNVYSIDEVTSLLKKHNFKIRVIKDFIEDEKVLLIGEK